MSLTAGQSAYVREVLARSPLLAFNEAERTFDITVERPTWAQIESLGPAIQKLRNTPPPMPFSGLTVDRLVMGYRDRCLQRYMVQRFREGRRHAETCWVRFGENTYCVGRAEPGEAFDDEARAQVLDRLAAREDSHIYASIARAWRRDRSLIKAVQRDRDGFVMFMAEIPIITLQRRWKVRLAIDRWMKRLGLRREEDRVVGIVRSIEARGWSNELARMPSSSVLGFSRTARRYAAITGRHRLAAARYLFDHGRLAVSTFIEVPIVTYPWPTWPYSRPHPDTLICEDCR